MSDKLENAVDSMGYDLESSKITDFYGGSGVVPEVAAKLQKEIEGMSDKQKAQLKAGAAEVMGLLGSTGDPDGSISNGIPSKLDPLYQPSSSATDATKMIPDDRKKEDDLIYAVLDAKTSHHRLHDIFQVKSGQEPVLNFMSILFYGDAEPIDVKKAEMVNGKLVLTLADDRKVPIGPTQPWTGVLVNHNAKVKEIRVRGYARDVTRSIRMQSMLNGILQQIDE